MTVLDDAAALIEARLQELDAERKPLQRALAELGPRRPQRAPARKAPKRNPKAKKATGRKAPKRSGPTRSDQVLTQIKADPTIRPGQIAKALGISAGQVSNLLAALRKSGTLKRDKRSKKWVVS